MNPRRAALADLDQLGLAMPDQPEGTLPDLPGDLTALSDRSLMALLAELSAWTDYAAGIVAEHQIDEERATADLERERAEASLRHGGQKSVTAQKAAAIADPQVRELDDAYQSVRARRRLVEVVRDSAERRAAVVSRELTRRVGRHDREARNSRWNP